MKTNVGKDAPATWSVTSYRYVSSLGRREHLVAAEFWLDEDKVGNKQSNDNSGLDKGEAGGLATNVLRVLHRLDGMHRNTVVHDLTPVTGRADRWLSIHFAANDTPMLALHKRIILTGSMKKTHVSSAES